MATNTCADDRGGMPSPKKKLKQVHSQKFLESYKKTYPCFSESQSGEKFAFCTICRTDLSVTHGGISDLKKHVESKKHIDYGTINKSQANIASFFPKTNDDDAIKAEVVFTKFLIENNLPLSISDTAGTMFRNMFADSKIAKKYGCARTKATAITRCLADHDEKEITRIISNSPFSIATDGSNDYGDTKLYPIIVKFFDETCGRILTTMLTMPECSGRSTGENIFRLHVCMTRDIPCQIPEQINNVHPDRLMDGELQKRHIPWSNCVSFAADNASVMSGVHKGVISFVRKENPDIYFMGCPCHLIHLAAEKGANVLPVPIEDQLVNIYYYLDKSSKRQMELKELQILHDTEVRKILKHVSTRWLSMGTCLDRVISQWVPLQEFFRTESKDINKNIREKSTKVPVATKPKEAQGPKETPKPKEAQKPSGLSFLFSEDAKSSKQVNPKDIQKQKTPTVPSKEKPTINIQRGNSDCAKKKAERIYENLRSRNFKLFCLFLKGVLPTFDEANKLLQNEKPCIHILHDVLLGLLEKFLTRFVVPSAILEAGSSTEVQFDNRRNQKDDKDLTIGSEAKDFIKNNPELNLNQFYQCVRAYYCTVCSYMCKSFPIGDEVLVNAAVADIKKRREVGFQSVSYFVEKFSVIGRCVGKDAIDQLEEQFLQYQIHPLTTEIMECVRGDTAWVLISEIKDPITLKPAFQLLAKVMLAVLTIFHSNTDCERIFSIVTKAKTKFRPNMQTATLSAIVTHKVCMSNRGELAAKAAPSKSLLKAAKSATYNMLQS